jgi:hypothetical protein
MNNNLHHVLQACLQEMQDGPGPVRPILLQQDGPGAPSAVALPGDSLNTVR